MMVFRNEILAAWFANTPSQLKDGRDILKVITADINK